MQAHHRSSLHHSAAQQAQTSATAARVSTRVSTNRRGDETGRRANVGTSASMIAAAIKSRGAGSIQDALTPLVRAAALVGMPAESLRRKVHKGEIEAGRTPRDRRLLLVRPADVE